MDRNSVGFLYVKNKFPRTSDAKIKEGVFIGPQTEFKQAVKFGDQLNKVQKNQHGNHSKMSLSIFMENHMAENYSDMVAVFVQSYKSMGCNMSFKHAFLRLSLRLLPGVTSGQ